MGTASRRANRRVWCLLKSLASHTAENPVRVKDFADLNDDVVDAAMAQGLGATLAQVLDLGGVKLPQRLRTHGEGARFVHAAAMDVLRHIEASLKPAGIRWAILKGPVIAAHYPDASLRSYGDIDILVHGRDLRQVLDTLDQAGINDVNRNWLNYRSHRVAETPMWAHGIAVDVHWHLLPLGVRRDRFAIDTEALLSRRRSIDIAGTLLPTLDREDFLFHVCLHAAAGGATRLGWLRDIRELINADPPDWSVFVDRCRVSGAGPVIAQTLDRSRVTLGADVPAWLLAELCPELLLRTRRLIDRYDSGAGLPSRFLRGLPVAVSGDGIADTARLVVAETRRRLGSAQDWNVGSPDGPLYWDRSSGGPDARDDYLEFAQAESDRLGPRTETGGTAASS